MAVVIGKVSLKVDTEDTIKVAPQLELVFMDATAKAKIPRDFSDGQRLIYPAPCGEFNMRQPFSQFVVLFA